jgi:AsmA protein
MQKNLKIACFAIAGLVCLLVIAASVALFLVDTNVHKPRLEKLASSTLGMQVTIGGPLGVSFFPQLHITARDVQIRNRGKDIAGVKNADLGIEFAPLLRKEVRFSRITLKAPLFSIERDKNGHYNYEQAEETKQARRPLDLAQVHILGGTLQYADRLYDETVLAEHCNGELGGLRHPGGPGFLSQLSLTAEFTCGALKTKKINASDLKFSLDGKEGVFDFKPLTMTVFGGQGSGSLQLQRSGSVPRTHLQYALSQFRIEDYFKVSKPEKVATGLMDLSVELSMQGKTRHEQRRTADGQVSLVGKDLTLVGRDLDKELAHFEASQNFSLIDLSAFFFAGPVGLAVTQGYDFSNLFLQSGGNTPIHVLVSKWKVENGVAHAQDVALATEENRLALQGGLDFVHEEFTGVTVAVIDEKGCPVVRQRIHGPFQKPVTDKPDFLTTLAGPAINLLKKAKDFLTNEKCEVFYTGSVAPPK